MTVKPTTNTEIAEDFRLKLARETLAATETRHGSYGEAVGQVCELRAVVGHLLNYIDEKDAQNVRTPGAETLDVLRTVQQALDVKAAELERLTAIEATVERIERMLAAEVATIANALATAAEVDRQS